ncbi:unnamed protein product [Linum trigynum]|uniref:Uncharacterized protein n=2 Tax=Linum trigynum TaxID=586398 RepID=A0AAV2EZU7_9ROSI
MKLGPVLFCVLDPPLEGRRISQRLFWEEGWFLVVLRISTANGMYWSDVVVRVDRDAIIKQKAALKQSLVRVIEAKLPNYPPPTRAGSTLTIGSQAPRVDDSKRELFKKVISYMTIGIDVSSLFGEMVMCSTTP